MKRVLSVLLTLALAMSLTACGGGQSSSGSSASSGSSTSGGSAASTSDSGYTGGSYTISLGHICSETHSLHRACLEFEKFVEEQSGGAISVELHPNGVLGGLKMRCMSNEMFVTMFDLMGANATPMSFSELFTALQQGTVDGQENPASLIYESKFQEVQKYFTTTEHIYDFCTIIINSDFYNALDEQAKAIVDEGVQTYLVDYQRDLEVSENDEYIQKLADEGMEVTYLTDEQKATFVDAVAPMYDNAAETFGQDVMDAVAEYR